MEKTNVTLRVNKEVIDKARKLGVNLSSITESMLRTENLIGEGELITPEKIRNAYRKVFIKLHDILKIWNVYLEIGFEVDEMTSTDMKGKVSFTPVDFFYYLSPSGKISVNWEAEEMASWKLKDDWPVDPLYEPEKLVENLIGALSRKAEKNKEKLDKLALLKNVLDKVGETKDVGKSNI